MSTLPYLEGKSEATSTSSRPSDSLSERKLIAWLKISSVSDDPLVLRESLLLTFLLFLPLTSLFTFLISFESL